MDSAEEGCPASPAEASPLLLCEDVGVTACRDVLNAGERPATFERLVDGRETGRWVRRNDYRAAPRGSRPRR